MVGAVNRMQFLNHVRFQQRCTDYRLVQSDEAAAVGRYHYYPSEPDEEAENTRLDGLLDGIQRAATRLDEDIRATRRFHIEVLGYLGNA